MLDHNKQKNKNTTQESTNMTYFSPIRGKINPTNFIFIQPTSFNNKFIEELLRDMENDSSTQKEKNQKHVPNQGALHEEQGGPG